MREDKFANGMYIAIALLVIILLGVFLWPKSNNNVVHPNEYPENIVLSRHQVSVLVGDSFQLEAIVSPSTAINKSVTYYSNNGTVATVDSNGKITGLSQGEATIVASTVNNKTATVVVTVTEEEIYPSSISLNYDDIILIEGETIKLKTTISPSNTTKNKLYWTSSDNSVVTVNNGELTALKAGDALITVKTENGKMAICDVEVHKKVVTLTLEPTTLSLEINKSSKLTATINPSTEKINWTSSNESVATVDSSGMVTAKKEGTAIIKASSGDISKECIITVNNQSTPAGQMSSLTKISYNSPTLKYRVDSYDNYVVTYVWVENAYDQMKVAITPAKSSSSEVPRTVQKAGNLINGEISSKNYTSKGLVAVNASSIVSSKFGTTLPSDWFGTASTPIVIYEGRILRNSLNGSNPAAASKKIYGLSKNNELKYYSYTNGATAERIATNQKTYNAIINDGIKYTFGFWPVLVENGTLMSSNYSNAQDSFKSNNIRQSICQVDQNNFILITSTNSTSTRVKNGLSLEQLGKLMISFKCKTGFNLDGGGSTSYYYKKSGASKATVLKTGYDNRDIVDMLYFVEK